MSKEDLLQALHAPSHHTLYTEFLNKIQDYEIINICLVDGELIKIGSGSKLKKNSIITVTPDFITIQYDSHITDVMFTAIKYIEYY